MKIYGFLNPRAGAGKTTLTFHLGWLFADAGFRVLLADLDPQGDLTVLATTGGFEAPTIHDALAPVFLGGEAIAKIPPHRMTERLHLLRGDIALADTDDFFAQAWPTSSASSCIRELLVTTARDLDADLVLCDLGSNLGAFTRAAAWATDGLIMPLTSKESVDGSVRLQKLAEVLQAWKTRSDTRSDAFELLGYMLTWASHQPPPKLEGFRLLGAARAYPTLYSMARAARRPIFSLSPSDGVQGSLQYAARDALTEYENAAAAIATVGGLFDEMGLQGLIAEAIAEAHAEASIDFDLPFQAFVDGLSITHVDGVRISNGHMRVHGSGLVEVEQVIDGGEQEGEPHELSFAFDLELDRDRSLAHLHELRVHPPEPSTSG